MRLNFFKKTDKRNKGDGSLVKSNVHLIGCTYDESVMRLEHGNADSFLWECNVYLERHKSDFIMPCQIIGRNVIIYNVKSACSLRELLSTHPKKLVIILYELFKFIVRLRDFEFIHGNLHIDNIFVECVDGRYSFKVVDLSNAYMRGIQPIGKVSRTSFLGEFDLKESNILLNWDMYTCITSLNEFYKGSKTKRDLTIKIAGLFVHWSVFLRCEDTLSTRHKTVYLEKPIFWDD